MNAIAQRLREARSKRGLTTKEVAAMIHAYPSQVSQWENGHNQPGVTVLRKYVELGFITADEAMGIEGAA